MYLSFLCFYLFVNKSTLLIRICKWNINSKIFVYIIYKADLLNASLGERMKQNYALSAYYIVEGFKKSGDPRQAELFRQKMSAAGMEIPKEQGEPRLKVF